MGGDESPPLEDEGEADDDGSHAAIEQMSERQLQEEIKAMEAKLAAQSASNADDQKGAKGKRGQKAQEKAVAKTEKSVKDDEQINPAIAAMERQHRRRKAEMTDKEKSKAAQELIIRMKLAVQ